MKKQVPHLLLAIDLGASGTKIVASVVGQPDCKAVLMEPHCVQVNDRQLLTPDPQFDEHNVWVRIADKFYAVGNLALIKHNATNKLKPAKFTIAVPKICAAIGVFAQKFNLPDKFYLSITFVLPPAEWEQRTIVIEQLQIATKDLETPRVKIKPRLLNIYPYPEGMGILLGQKLDLKEFKAVTVVMLGFRNASVFTSRYGTVSRPQSSDLGFHDLVFEIAGKTGYKTSDMIVPIFEYERYTKSARFYTKLLDDLQIQIVLWEFKTRDGRYGGTPPVLGDVKKYQKYIDESNANAAIKLDSLLRCTGEDRFTELKILTNLVDRVNEAYWTKLSDWLQEVMLSQSDKICLCGGTANYFEDKLKEFMKDKASAHSEKNVSFHGLIKPPDDLHLRDNRFEDIYSLWHQMAQRQIATSKAG